jgi:hypothetical protein
MCSPLTGLFRHRCRESRQAVQAAPFSQTVRSTGRLTRLDRSFDRPVMFSRIE